MELRGPIAGCFLALLVIPGIHEGGAILEEPGQLVKLLGTIFLGPLSGGLSRSSQPLEPNGQTFGPCRAPGTIRASVAQRSVPMILKADPSGVIAVQCFVKIAPPTAEKTFHQFDGLTTNSPLKQAI
jgi:hypothetical protein